MISASQHGTLKLWDLESGRALVTMTGHLAEVRACAVTADGQRLISTSVDQTIRVWELESGRTLATMTGHARSVRACALMRGDRYLISASEDRTLKIWDLHTSTCLFTHWGDAAFTAVAVTATTIVAGDDSGAVWFLDWPGPDHHASPFPRRRRP